MQPQQGMLVPTLDVDLVWHTHLLILSAYQAFCVRYCDRIINHDNTIERAHLAAGFETTRKLWADKFDEGYLMQDIDRVRDAESLLLTLQSEATENEYRLKIAETRVFKIRQNVLSRHIKLRELVPGIDLKLESLGSEQKYKEQFAFLRKFDPEQKPFLDELWRLQEELRGLEAEVTERRTARETYRSRIRQADTVKKDAAEKPSKNGGALCCAPCSAASRTGIQNENGSESGGHEAPSKDLGSSDGGSIGDSGGS